MSEKIPHECGLALVRLLKPLEFYQEKYGTSLYGLSKLQLLLQKQRNRGQDGAGIAVIKFDRPPGYRYISRKRTVGPNYLEKLFKQVYKHFKDVSPEKMADPQWLKDNRPYVGELYLGHLRYGTHGLNTIESCHPFLRKNNWISRTLALAGNFNLTNVDELFDELVELGQYPKEKSEAVTVLEKIGHFLDDEVQRLFNWFKPEGYTNEEVNQLIFENLDIQRILTRACKRFDGGYVMAGMLGYGDAFVCRDPHGIRPAYYYQDDEVLVVASERPAIQTAFNKFHTDIKEIGPGNALIIKKDGSVEEKTFIGGAKKLSCSFERIYFSRGNDYHIYQERKTLGRKLAKHAMNSLKNDFQNVVFSFIPNTAEVAFIGLVDELHSLHNENKNDRIVALDPGTKEEVKKILDEKLRIEKLVVKDAKMRTFIADDLMRDQLVSHVYDVTYGLVKNNVDAVVLIDDSIVRGTTLRDSILSMVSRLLPTKIIVLSSAPQIRYPDCYGIDMSQLGRFAAFQAMVSLLKKTGKDDLLLQVYEKCKQSEALEIKNVVNHVKELYDQFEYEEVSAEIANMLSTKLGPGMELEIIYQTVEDLNTSCPENLGDWYFSGNYPTPGGRRIVNRSFINFMEKKAVRAY